MTPRLSLSLSLRLFRTSRLGGLLLLSLFARDAFGFRRFLLAAIFLCLTPRLSLSLSLRLFRTSRLGRLSSLKKFARDAFGFRRFPGAAFLFRPTRRFGLGLALGFLSTSRLGGLLLLSLFARDAFGFRRFLLAAIFLCLTRRLSLSLRLFRTSRLGRLSPLALLACGARGVRHLFRLAFLLRSPPGFRMNYSPALRLGSLPLLALLPCGALGVRRLLRSAFLLCSPHRLRLGQSPGLRRLGGVLLLALLARSAFRFRTLAQLLLDQRKGASQSSRTSASNWAWETSIPCRRESFFRLSGRSVGSRHRRAVDEHGNDPHRRGASAASISMRTKSFGSSRSGDGCPR